MTNSLPASALKLLRSWISSPEKMLRREALRSPEVFRQVLRLPGEGAPLLRDVLQPWQRNDLAALDAAWRDLAGAGRSSTNAVFRRAYVERPRGHSKTSDMAVQIAWILLAARQPVSGLAAAADRDQGRLLQDALRRLAAANQELCEPLQFLCDRVRHRQSGSRLEVISSDVASSYGALADFIVCDELSHWPKAELWHSLISTAAKKPRCVLTVLTNAGVGRGWQWDVREHARTDPHWHFSSLEGPQAPWITDDWLSEQRALLPTPVYERLWLNLWQQAEGNFLTLFEAEACRNPERSYQRDGQPGRHYVAAIDYAEKIDFTVGCVCHREGELVVVDRMDVVQPSAQNPTLVAWVEDWIEDVASRFHSVQFVIDAYQLIGTMQRLEHKYPMQRFPFAAGEGNHRLAQALRRLAVHRQVEWYPGCGGVPGPHRNDLETELASLILRQSASGKVRIDHVADGRHHDDRSFALGACCVTLLEATGAPSLLDITPPTLAGGFDW